MIHAMRIKGVTLVDNNQFLELVRTKPNSLSFCENYEPLLENKPLGFGIEKMLSSVHGATRLDTADELVLAMYDIY